MTMKDAWWAIETEKVGERGSHNHCYWVNAYFRQIDKMLPPWMHEPHPSDRYDRRAPKETT